MSYITAALLWIAPIIIAPLDQQQKPDSGVKEGAVQKHASPKQQNPKQGQAPAKPHEATEVFNYPNPVETPASQPEKRDTYDPRHDTLYRAYLWFTIFGVPVALGALYVIYRQTRHIAQQTAHLERQIEIQQRSSRQWVNVLEWRQHPHESMTNTIGIYFQIENPTAIPLRLDMVMSGALGQRQNSGLVTFLVPENPFPHEFFVKLNAEQIAHYEGNGLVLEVEVSVFFTDAFDNQWNQIFQRTLFCRRHNNYLFVRESRTRMRRSGPNDPHED